MLKVNQKPAFSRPGPRPMADGYVIGVDGGGTKTVAALADLKGRILKIGRSGSTNPTNVGVIKAAESVKSSIEKVLPQKGKVISIFVGLPAVAERPELIKEVKKAIDFPPDLKNKIKIGSDQLVAFRSGTDKKEGVLVIAGTGCVAHGWQKKKEVHVSGWGWLADEGSAFWLDQKTFQAVLKSFDGRGPKTILENLIFKKFKIRKIADLINLVYLKNPTEIIPLFSIICDEAAKKEDEIAKNILTEAGKELAISAKAVIKKLQFRKRKFPLVLVGSTFKSKIILETVKKEVKKFAPKVEFIRPKAEPVMGAVKLTLEQLKNENSQS